VVKPAVRKRIAEHSAKTSKLSERTDCRLAGISRTAYRYVQKLYPVQTVISERLKVLAVEYPRYGYFMLHGLLKAEGLVKNKNQTYRIYSEEGLQVRTKKRKKIQHPRLPMMILSVKNQRWLMNFVSD